MSSNDPSVFNPQSPLRNGSSAAADVSFAKLNSEHHAESSSLAESSRSRERKSGLAERLTGDRDKKRHSGHESRSGDRSSNGSSTPQRSKKSGGFLLDSLFANGQATAPGSTRRHGKAREQNGHFSMDKRSSAQQRVSGEWSQRSSPLSREMSGGKPTDAPQGKTSNPQTSSMDPAQLVQMALNLSESRRRHVSSSLPIPVTPAGGRRVVSALDSGYGTVKSGSSGGKRASYLSSDAPESYKTSPHDRDGHEPAREGDNVVYTFSPATLSRAEKARRYFELASEHRRLLEHLPPLKSDASAPENYSLQATSSPGSAHFDMNRVPSNTTFKRQLGRMYNPLQALRNRRLRNRERRPLTAPPDTWQDTDRIKRWIDGVEATSNDPSFRPGEDRVRLPAFSGELEGEIERPETANRHRRTDTVNSVITRPDNGWSIEPAELLADTYWVEKEDNKTIIEDRHGNRILPLRSRLSVEGPRRSREFDHSNDYNTDQQSHHNESEDDEKPRTRRRNLLPIPGRLRRNYKSRSPSTTSNSSDEGRKPPALRFGDPEGADENVGPLDRHMRRMIAKEEKGELTSPELASPDHWDNKYGQSHQTHSSVDRARQEPHQTANGRLSVDSRGHRRSKSAEGRMGSIDLGSMPMDEVTTGNPSSSTLR